MGGFVTAAKKVVKWIGGCINKVISWWKSFRDDVDQKTINYIIIYQNVIIKADDPEVFGEVLAIKKEKSELERIAQQKYLKLSGRDRQNIDALLDNRDY
jgi:hypothetical protein